MKQILPFIFILLFLGILLGANIYLSRRFALYFGAETVWPLHLGFALLTVLMILGVALFTNSTGITGNLIYSTGAILMGFLLYLLLSLLLVDLASLFIKTETRYYGYAVLCLCLAACTYGMINAFHIRTNEIEVEIPGLKQEVRAMHLTDIHLGHFRGVGFLQKLVNMTNEQHVEMVLITGDLYDGRIRFCDACLDPLHALSAPVYFIEGNHDGYSGIGRVKSGLSKVGVKVLSNEMATQGELQIIGLNHMSADKNNVNMHANGQTATMKSTLPGIPADPDKPMILLHHSPHGIEYANQKGVDLYLAGHTHGGQLFPVNYIGGLIYKYNKGLHDYQGTKIYVGEGAGTFGPPMRLGTHSTITVIKLKPGKADLHETE